MKRQTFLAKNKDKRQHLFGGTAGSTHARPIRSL